MKQLINQILLFITGLLLYSCSKSKQIECKDLKGTWVIKTAEDAKDYNIASIQLLDKEAWIEPFADTLYFYPRYVLRNDTLIFYDIYQKTLSLPVAYLKGDDLILEGESWLSHKPHFKKLNDENHNRRYRTIKPEEVSEDSIDIIIRGTVVALPYNDEDTTAFVLSHSDMVKARNLVKLRLEEEIKSPHPTGYKIVRVSGPKSGKKLPPTQIEHRKRPYPFHKYFRQYMAYKDRSNGHIMVRVQLLRSYQYEVSSWQGSWYYDLMLEPYFCHDGGRDYIDATVDLTGRRITSFQVHGEA